MRATFCRRFFFNFFIIVQMNRHSSKHLFTIDVGCVPAQRIWFVHEFNIQTSTHARAHAPQTHSRKLNSFCEYIKYDNHKSNVSMS